MVTYPGWVTLSGQPTCGSLGMTTVQMRLPSTFSRVFWGRILELEMGIQEEDYLRATWTVDASPLALSISIYSNRSVHRGEILKTIDLEQDFG